MTMTCKTCLHYEVCKHHDAVVDFPVDDGVCRFFEDRTKWVEQKRGRWIPITERMPEENGAYLVATERGGVFITHYSKRGQRFSISRLGSDVTHWQERPMPPKEED